MGMNGNNELCIKLKEVKGKLVDFRPPCDCCSGYKLHKFQKKYFEMFMEVSEKSGKFAFFIIAPTGAGKTLCADFPVIYLKNHKKSRVKKELKIYPTNELIKDQERSLTDLLNKHIKGDKKNVKTLFSDEITELQYEIEQQKGGKVKRYEVIKNIISDADMVLTNPDIYFLISFGIYSSYLVGEKSLQFDFWTDFFNNFNYIVFDEFHLYDFKQKGEILLSLLILGNFFEESRKPFFAVFMSATPYGHEFIRYHLKKAGFEIKEINFWDEEDDKEDVEGEYETRTITGPVELNLIGKNLYTAEDYEYIKEILDEKKLISKVKDGKKLLICSENAGAILEISDDIKERLKQIEKDGSSKLQLAIIYGYEKRGEISSDIVVGTIGAIGQGIDFSGKSLKSILVGTARSSGSFTQVLGRIGRGDDKLSEAYMIVPDYVVEKLHQIGLHNQMEMEKKEFFEKIAEAYQERNLEQLYENFYKKSLSPFLSKLIKMYREYGEGESKELCEKIIKDIWWGEDKEIKIEEIEKEVNNIIQGFQKEIKEVEGIDINLKDFPECVFESEYLKRFYNFRGASILCGIIRERDGKKDYTFYDALWVVKNLDVEVINEKDFVEEVLSKVICSCQGTNHSEKCEGEKEKRKLEMKIDISLPAFYCKEKGKNRKSIKIEVEKIQKSLELPSGRKRRIGNSSNIRKIHELPLGELCFGRIKISGIDSEIAKEFQKLSFIIFGRRESDRWRMSSIPFYIRWFKSKKDEIIFLERDAIMACEIFKMRGTEK